MSCGPRSSSWRPKGSTTKIAAHLDTRREAVSKWPGDGKRAVCLGQTVFRVVDNRSIGVAAIRRLAKDWPERI
jgi:hypothetical protein